MRIKSFIKKFETEFDVIENGTGKFFGALEDLDLSEGPSVSWVAPRRILKVNPKLHLKARMVIQSKAGIKYMIANFSTSETAMGVAFKAFRLYEATSVATLTRRTTVTDARTGMKREGPLSDPIQIYVSYEPLQEAFDRELRVPNEKTRIITNYPVKNGDIIDGETVIEVHDALGLFGAILG